MKSFFKQLTAAAFFVVTALAQDFRIETPIAPVQCRPLQFMWSGGNPPYYLSILPGGNPTAPALLDLGEIESGNAYRWVVNFGTGTSLGATLRDSDGQIAQSGTFTVQPSNDDSCVGVNPDETTTDIGSTVATGSTSTTRSAGASSSGSARPSTSAPAEDDDDDDSSAASNMIPATVAAVAGAAVLFLA